MVIAFIEEFPEGTELEPPKYAHITVKKKFKLVDIDESELIRMLLSAQKLRRPIKLRLGDVRPYGSDEFMIVEVLNAEEWTKLHNQIAEILGAHIESRDLQFEKKNYLPHLSWKVRNKVLLDPTPYLHTEHLISRLYLVQRIHPEKSHAQILAKIDL
jgi:2'-5' RNA ligase